MTDNAIEIIRAALAADATPEVKAAGVVACRAILTALGATPGEPLGPTPNISPAANAIAALIRSRPPEELFELLITKVRSMLPPDSQPSTVRKMTIPHVPVPKL